MRRLIFVRCHIGFLNVMKVANCGYIVLFLFKGILERGSVPKEARKCSAAQAPHIEVVPRAF